MAVSVTTPRLCRWKPRTLGKRCAAALSQATITMQLHGKLTAAIDVVTMNSGGRRIRDGRVRACVTGVHAAAVLKGVVIRPACHDR